jgi:hypothetical protein
MNKDRAAGYIAAGVGYSQVASIMGCTPAYISQLVKEEDFKLLVAKHQEKVDGTPEAEEVSISTKYLGLEHQLLKAMGDALPNAELPAITRALEVVATRQEKAAIRKLPAHAGGGNTSNLGITIQLTLPHHAIPAQPVIELNAKSEVVAIDHKPMSPMSSVGVEKLFRQRKAEASIVKEIE